MEDDQLETIFNSLTGKYKHYCFEFDGLPVDETMEEFVYCNCVHLTQEVINIKEEMEKIVKEWSNNVE